MPPNAVHATSALRRGLRALAAATTLALILVGFPALLAATIGNPLDSWDDLLAGDASNTVVIDVLAAVAWLAWAQFTLITVVEAARTALDVAARTAGRPWASTSPRPPATGILGTQQSLARALITTAFLIGPATLPTAGPAAAGSTSAVTASADLTLAVTPVTAAGAADPTSTTGPTPVSPPARHTTTHVVDEDGPGTLWDLARTFLGSGERWPEIWALNEGRRQGDGTIMTSPGLLRPGWTIVIPTDAHRGSPGQSDIVTVRRGDTLGEIAAEHGHPDWHTVWNVNRGSRQPDGATFTDPDHIEPGWRITVPPSKPVDAATKPPATNPTPTPTDPSPTPPAAGGRSPSGTPASEPSRQTAAPAPDDDRAAPSLPASETTDAPDPPPAHEPEDEPGAAFDGGWIGLPLAAALVAAAALVWRRRRHRYIPGPLTPEELEDPDLRPMPSPIAAARRAVREQAPELLNPPEEPPTVTEYAASGYAHRLPPPGPDGTDLAGLSQLVTDSGLGLTGPGAEAAARALLVATLSAGSPQDPEAKGQVVIPADTLTTLLGVHAVDLGPIPRMTVTASLADALTALDQILLERRRTLDEHDTTDLEQLRADHPYHPLTPPVLLISDVPTAAQRSRLTATLRLGLPLRISAVLLGTSARGDTLDLDDDGRPTNLDPASHDGARRVAALDVPTTVELLHVLREAHTGEPRQPPTEPGRPDQPDHPQTPETGPAAPTAHEPDDQGQQTSPAADASGSGPGDAADSEADVQSTRVHVAVLGLPRVLDQEGEPVSGLRRNATQLLLYLVAHRSGADLSEIMEAIWPAATVRRAQERLSTEVANLRRTVRQAVGDPTAQAVINTGSRYHLNPELIDVDAWNLSDALHDAANTTDPAERINALRRTVDLHTGTFAEGVDIADWIEPYREHYRRHGIRARIHLADLLASTDPERAADLAEAAADLDPSNEAVARTAISALARAGRPERIRIRLHRLTQALEEIDEEPSPETLALASKLTSNADQRPTSGNRNDPDRDDHP
jgi:DNA-binding SARP family transcriptional activator/nucleoid-associated protein YgaU